METREPSNIFELAIRILKQRRYALVTLAGFAGFFVLYSFISGFWQIPGISLRFVRDTPITAYDVLYIVLVAVFAGLLITLLKYKADEVRLKTEKGVAGVGALIAGIFSASCPVCQGVAIAAFGTTFFSVPFGPLVPYISVLKIVGLATLVLAIYLTLDSIYTKTCRI
ncbi:MAG: hypothetical protein HYT16_01655 [DPANN group archaeon]|nr:hypothetical protein [DPANN group archaeon]